MKHAVVTGGGRGIGASIAQMLDQLGYKTTIVGRDEASLEKKVSELDNAEYRILDITDHQAVAKTFSELDTVDVLVNNAGVAPSASFVKTSLDVWQQTLNVNLNGAFYCSQAVVPPMLSQGYGRIINIASTSALKGYAYVAAYCAAKHGLLGLTRALAVEYVKTGVTINAICPGFTETELLETAVENIVNKTGRSSDEAKAALYASNPQKRFIQPQEISDAVVWLLGENSASITGQAISISGGEVM